MTDSRGAEPLETRADWYAASPAKWLTAPRTTNERGPVQLRRNENGTIAIVGTVPRIVEVSAELFAEFIFEFNELKRGQQK